MTRQQELTRRRFLWATAAAATVGACGTDDGGAEPVDTPGPNGATDPGEYRESPSLATRVQAGELPPVSERLPETPLVVRPGLLIGDGADAFQTGQYGGTLQLPHASPQFDGPIAEANIEPLLWAPGGFGFVEGSAIEGNLVAGYESNADDTAFTFHMRKGLRWSDGEPVTTEDVRFAFEDLLYNERVTQTIPSALRSESRSDGSPVQLEIADEFTFSLIFDRPYGSFPTQIAMGGIRGYGLIITPRHYLERFHEKYADPDELKEMLAEESLAEDEWYALLNNKKLDGLQNVSTQTSLGHPLLTPWIMSESGSEILEYVRNPYYFKVDSDGNQLPYVDGIRAQVVEDAQTLATQALFGEFDYVAERITIRSLPLMQERVEAGDAKAPMMRHLRVPITFELNLTHPDDAWRNVVRDVRFRQALSLAVNRDDIIDTFFFGEFARASSQINPPDYDPDEANRLLDLVGLDERDNDGFRMRPDGERFSIPLQVENLTEDHIPMSELVSEHWRSVGLDVTVTPATGDVVRDLGNELMATVRNFVDPDVWPTGFAVHHLPDSTFSHWGLLWKAWYESGGSDGERPPEEVEELYELHAEFVSAGIDSPERNAAMDGILENHRSNIWVIAPLEGVYTPAMFGSRIKNVPQEGMVDVFTNVLNMSMEQWYIEA